MYCGANIMHLIEFTCIDSLNRTGVFAEKEYPSNTCIVHKFDTSVSYVKGFVYRS